MMKKGDFLWVLALGCFIALLVAPVTHALFIAMTAAHPYFMGFLKFAVLATMGELLALRIVTGAWKKPAGLLYRSLVWGFIGMVIVLAFEIFSTGVKGALDKGLLPGKDFPLVVAFMISLFNNILFAPTFMAFHRITDTYLDLKMENGKNVALKEVVAKIDWSGFVSFVLLRTVPFFWVPAHTITFLLPTEYRVLFAAMLSICLGAILAYAKKQSPSKSVNTREEMTQGV